VVWALFSFVYHFLLFLHIISHGDYVQAKRKGLNRDRSCLLPTPPLYHAGFKMSNLKYTTATALATTASMVCEEYLPHPYKFTGSLDEVGSRAVSIMVKRERMDRTWRVGMQLSDCGSGKTRMMLACIAANGGTTIIFTLPTLVLQWKLRIAQMIPTFASSIVVLDYNNTSSEQMSSLVAKRTWNRLVLDAVHHTAGSILDLVQPFLIQETAHLRYFIWLITGTPSVQMYENILPVLFPGIDVEIEREGGPAATRGDSAIPLGEFIARVSVCVTPPPRDDLTQTTEVIELTQKEMDFLGRVRGLRVWRPRNDHDPQNEAEREAIYNFITTGHLWSWGRARRIKRIVYSIQVQTPHARVLVLSAFLDTVAAIGDCFTRSGVVHTRPCELPKRVQGGGGMLLLASFASICGLNLPAAISHVVLAEPTSNSNILDTLAHVYNDTGSDIQVITVEIESHKQVQHL
jgi:hypothetical protein